jgi:hypothetical protein
LIFPKNFATIPIKEKNQPKQKKRTRAKGGIKMGYQLKEGESHIVHCFECKEAFELTKEHEQNYISSSLCPKCFNKAMAEMHSEMDIYLNKIVKTLGDILKDINAINNDIKKILEGGK